MRTPLLALAIALSGCATVVPFQTASTVPPHTVRVGGQATFPAYCTFSLAPQNCTESFGTMSLPVVPELRASARMGLTPWADAGASVHGLVRSSTALAGGFIDAKARFLQMPVGAGELIGSGGLGAGVTAGLPIAGAGLQGLTQVEIAVPLFFGYRRGGLEWIASPRVVDRMRFVDINGDGQREVLSVIEPGIALGVVGGGGWKWSVQIEYHAPLDYLADGPILLGFGLLFDVGMVHRGADEPDADTLEGGGTP